jgi:prolyl oligopeptidase
MRSVCLAALVSACAATGAPLKYPEARRADIVETMHGVQVADPYRWLEDPDSPETRAWIDAENAITEEFLAGAAAREPLKRRLTDLWNYERWSLPMREGGRWFFRKNRGLDAQSILYVADSLEAEPRVLLDPNQLAADGTVALQTFMPSPDGRYLAYALAGAGSDWIEWHVRDVNSGAEMADLVKWSKFSGASWTADAKGFFYSAYDAPKEGEELESVNYFQKLYYHRLGTPQSEDALIYHRPDEKEWGFDGTVSDDGRWLVITVWKGTDDTALVFYKDLSKKDAPVVPLVEKWEAEYGFIDNDGSVLFFKTNLDAPRGRVIAIDVATGKRREVIPQTEDTLESVDVVGERFLTVYLHDAASQVRLYGMDGKPAGVVQLPGIGTVYTTDARREDTETFYSFASFTMPTTLYRYTIATGASSLWKQPPLRFDPNGFETEQLFFTSKDGTKIPLFISKKKGLVPSASTPAYLYGYGGFNIPITPEFSVAPLAWMERGGLYVVANIRGGGEYGEAWHKAGTRLQKQNVFDDFIGAAEFLVQKGYTSSKRLAISGRSNGGLLVGACLVQRPDLFGAALPGVGVLDMLRFHKFTIGWAWIDDYGSPDVADEFRALYAYSPLHNLKSGTSYPPTLVTTADHDDRVVPAHSFKFAAALQAVQAGDAPVLIRIETKAGHGAGKPTDKVIEEQADILAFLTRVFEMPAAP